MDTKQEENKQLEKNDPAAKILQALGSLGKGENNGCFTLEQIADKNEINPLRVEYFLKKLQETEYVKSGISNEKEIYFLTSKGIETAIILDLI
uniref:hypothetical protein n=1 Tax=Candidatus Electrothrix sp. TaxID=2170559 RepID=UPI0040576BCF